MAKKVNLYAMQGDSRYAAPNTKGLITNPVQPNYGYTNVNITDPSMKAAYEKTTGYVKDAGNTASGYRPAEEMKNIEYTGARDLSHYGSKAKTPSYSYTPVSIGAQSLGHIGQFAPSQAYIDAMNYTQSLLDKINTGKTSYSDKVDAMMAKIEGRDPFSYDFNTDPLFQNMLGSAMASGQTAMQDTMGQAAALTGGYGSSYATSAGNQAYNQFVQNAYAQLPDFYNLALDAYTREGDEMYRQLGMYNDADDKEYGRLTNAYGLNYQKTQDMYGQEYNNYWDTANYNLNVDKFNADAAMDAARFNASQALDAAKFEYNQKQDALARADKLNAAKTSEAAEAGETSAKESTIKNIKSEGANILGRVAYGSDEYYEWLQGVANNYGASPEQVQEIDRYLRTIQKDLNEYSAIAVGGTKGRDYGLLY